MTLLVVSPDYASHALPLLTLAEAWRAAGERVVVATGPAVRPLVERAGMEHAQLSLGRGSNAGVARPEGQPAQEAESLRAFFEATRRGMIETLRYQAEARATDLLWRPVETARQTLAILESVRPREILVDHLAFGATLGLRAAGVPYGDVVLGHPRQLPVAGETYGVPGAWPAAFAVRAGTLAGLRAAARAVADRFTEAYNAALLELSASADPVADAFGAHGSLVLLNYPAAMHEPARTSLLPQRHAFLGALARQENLPVTVAEWAARDRHRPLVLVSLGTFLSSRDDVLATIARGLGGLGVRVAMAIGAADRESLGELPDDWLVMPVLPQVALLEHASLLVTHAGNNSVTEAIAAGVPMLALPFSTDQFDGAAAVEANRLGRAADPNRITPGTVARLAESALAMDGSPVEQLGRQLRNDPGAAVARRHMAGANGPLTLESVLVGR
jgi:zeaxanthin glucosyltransferase